MILGAPAGPTHAHRCSRCGTSWRHSCAMAGNTAAHTCPGCGAMQWQKAGRGMGDVAALIVGARPAIRGMAGLGDAEPPSVGTNILDQLSGGRVSQISSQLDDVELLLKVSTAAAVFAALATLIALGRK